MVHFPPGQDALVEVGEKYRKAMVSNAQLDNEKNNLMYQVDTLKDSLTELEEMLAESRRECEDKAKVRDGAPLKPVVLGTRKHALRVGYGSKRVEKNSVSSKLGAHDVPEMYCGISGVVKGV